MKFLWFHLMPYKELPEDFKERHPSVWVDIHSSLFDPGAPTTCTTSSWTSLNSPPNAGLTPFAATNITPTATA